MADFDQAIAFVLRHEDPRLSGIVTQDSGGQTRFGIAERFHPDLGDEFYRGAVEAALEVAREIYRMNYWRWIRGDDIHDQQVANKLLDMAVNMGVRQAIVLLQRAVNMNAPAPIAEDGVCGPCTLYGSNRADSQWLLQRLRESSAAFYQHLAAVRPETQPYLRGWLARAWT